MRLEEPKPCHDLMAKVLTKKIKIPMEEIILPAHHNFTFSFYRGVHGYERIEIGLRKLGYRPIINDISHDNIPEGCPHRPDETDGQCVWFLIRDVNVHSAAFIETAINKLSTAG